MPARTIFSPAKLNLFLAITGRRPDGFHELVSVVAPLRFGDTLRVELSGAAGDAGRFTLTCADSAVPTDDSNLVIKAAKRFAAAAGWKGGATFHLEKQIPIGAGLGGGSSNGAAALLALNGLTGEPLRAPQLLEVAAGLGSDCPLFLHGTPIVMRGRGERIEPLAEPAARRVSGRRVLVFKPAFGIATAWAYGAMAQAAQDPAQPSPYLAAPAAEERLTRWLAEATQPAEALLFNNMERAAFAKHLALPALLQELRSRFGLACGMSGSGSACFALLPANAAVDVIVSCIRAAWGDSAFVAVTQIA